MELDPTGVLSLLANSLAWGTGAFTLLFSFASLAAAAQNRFKAFHDARYAAGPVSDATIAQTARATGVDLAKLPSDADTTLRENLETAAKLGMTGTPAWVVGDQVLSGALPLERLKEAITKARVS